MYNKIKKYEIENNLTNDVKELYNENYKTQVREIKDLE